MITKQNLHMHSVWDDGHDTCLDMLEACRAIGFTSAGVSLHSPMPFTNDWAPGADGVQPYIRELAGLKGRFQKDFRVLAGIEWDVLSDPALMDGFDYVIGSVHHLPVKDVPPSVDNTPEELRQTVNEHFGGDADAAAACYFRELLKVAAEPRVQICGHFDLLLKFNEQQRIFNPESCAYQVAAKTALDALLDAGKVFEINTGAISRGWRSVPYPERRWLTEIAKRGGQVLLASDAHRAAHVATFFEESEMLLRSLGFDHVVELAADGTFVPVSLSV
ncbi:MAG: histidinol-phosphatase HisJ family protein [Clostridia bacterium]|nr:histidinol-phosphatase HisJ family protein [Clostridia bacterium]